jgi:hypothetical protein
LRKLPDASLREGGGIEELEGCGGEVRRFCFDIERTSNKR